MQETNNPLNMVLSIAVPLRIMAMAEKGGPDAEDMKKAHKAGDLLGEKGDKLLFGGKKGEAAELFNLLAHAITVLSFCPGGVTTFGQHFDGTKYNTLRLVSYKR